jgi:hypothetical protein
MTTTTPAVPPPDGATFTEPWLGSPGHPCRWVGANYIPLPDEHGGALLWIEAKQHADGTVELPTHPVHLSASAVATLSVEGAREIGHLLIQAADTLNRWAAK